MKGGRRREGGREGGREEEVERRREGRRKGGVEGGREGRGREEGRRSGGREEEGGVGGREGGRVGRGREKRRLLSVCIAIICIVDLNYINYAVCDSALTVEVTFGILCYSRTALRCSSSRLSSCIQRECLQ